MTTLERTPVALVAPLLVAALTLAACDKGDAGDTPSDSKSDKSDTAKKAGDDPADDQAETPPAPTDAGEPADDPAPAVTVDETVAAGVDAVVANCTVDIDGCSVKDCKGSEWDDLGKLVQDDANKHLESIAALYSGDDEAKAVIAANLMMSKARHLGETPTVSVATANALLDGLAKAKKYVANQAAPTIGLAAGASGDQGVIDRAFEVAVAHESEYAGAGVIRHTMRHGGMKALPKLMEVAKGDNPARSAAAVAAYREVFKPDGTLTAAVCPWAKEYVGHEDAQIRSEAGWVAIKCGGEYIDNLIAVGESRLEQNKFDRDDYMVYRDVCFSFMGEKTAGQEEQCNANYAFLQKVVDDEDIESSDRGLALFAIYYQRRDDTTKALAKKYRKHKDPEIKKRAEEIIEALED